ncbi:MAG: triple tyrosine motif-containing protein [Tenuifilaceae bacterium]
MSNSFYKTLLFKFSKFLIHFTILISVFTASSQNIIHVTNYFKNEYKGGNQNWDITQDEKGNIFVANNNGLLTFDGAKWGLLNFPFNTIIRSVAYDRNRVYSGSFEEFGFWESDSINEWKYTSLIPLLGDTKLHNDEFWKIVKHNNCIYFQSFGTILVYDYKTIKSIDIPGPVLFLLQSNNRLFVQQINGGLFEVIDQKLKFIEGSQIFQNTEINSLVSLSINEMLIGTSSKGVYKYNGVIFSAWDSDYSEELKESKINNGIRLNDKIVFGTILKGIYVYNLTGKLLNHVASNTSLQNNTILALHGDQNGNVWVGMDKGIDYISFNSPIDVYEDKEMETGAVYTACIYKNELYVGTNQGVYFFSIKSDGKFDNKQFIKNSQGQVWFLKVIDNKLYCGLNDGTYLIDNHQLRQVSNVSGGYNLKKISWQEKEYLIQSTYSTLVLYSNNNNTWTKSNSLDGLVAPFRYLEMDFLGNLWLGHSIKGLLMIQPSKNLDSIVSIKSIGKKEGFIDNTNKVFKVDNRIVLPSGKQLYRWDDVNNQVIPYDDLNDQLEGFESSVAIAPVPENKYWFVKKNEIGMFEVLFGKAKLLYRMIPQMYGLNLVENYENIVSLNDSLNLICLDNGFAILNIYSMNQLKEVNKPPVIKDVLALSSKGESVIIRSNNESKNQVANKFNNFSFSFTSNEPIGQRKFYQYKLEGIDNNWSDWTYGSEVTYKRLPFGNYTFLVHTINSKGIKTPPARFVFRIKPPLYLSIYAFLIYISIIGLLVFYLRLYIKRRFRQQKAILLQKEQEKISAQKEKAEQLIIKLENEKLQAEISYANSQLANNTISIIKKNELLIEIKDQLEKIKNDLGYRIPNKYYDGIYKLIDHNITSEHDWEMFEKLFDQAHENFFKRLKSAYPDLTSSDLRLCAYLRLNLSSKEIAPLINITIRGVEERRYRLRKRLNLLSDQNLTDFILTF